MLPEVNTALKSLGVGADGKPRRSRRRRNGVLGRLLCRNVPQVGMILVVSQRWHSKADIHTSPRFIETSQGLQFEVHHTDRGKLASVRAPTTLPRGYIIFMYLVLFIKTLGCSIRLPHAHRPSNPGSHVYTQSIYSHYTNVSPLM